MNRYNLGFISDAAIYEYARIQTFPDCWEFRGSLSAKYKQIGNAVPVNLAWALGRSLIRLFNDIESKFPASATCDHSDEYKPVTKLHGIFEGMACEKSTPYGDSQS